MHEPGPAIKTAHLPGRNWTGGAAASRPGKPWYVSGLVAERHVPGWWGGQGPHQRRCVQARANKGRVVGKRGDGPGRGSAPDAHQPPPQANQSKVYHSAGEGGGGSDGAKGLIPALVIKASSKVSCSSVRSRRTEMSSEMGQAVLNLAQRGPANPRSIGHGLPGLVAVEAKSGAGRSSVRAGWLNRREHTNLY